VEGVLGLDLEDDRAAQDRVAGVHEARVAVDALVGLALWCRLRVGGRLAAVLVLGGVCGGLVLVRRLGVQASVRWREVLARA
jgi:hypothetical protein